MIQLSGTVAIHWDEASSAARFPGAKRWMEFTVEAVVELPAGSLPIRWDSGSDELQLQVVQKVPESDDVTSFYLAAIPGESPTLPNYKPGQHLTLTLPVESDKSIVRSYSVSSYDPKNETYRVSIKRDPFGLGSKFMHDKIQEGDLLNVQKTAGDFVYDDSSDSDLVLFLSAGIGVTPILSMAHAFVGAPRYNNKALWIHSARDGRHHPFQEEVKDLVQKANDTMKNVVAYTRPDSSDTGFDHTGRIDQEVLAELIGDETSSRRIDVYMCGPSSFVGAMEESLSCVGIDESRIRFETF
jgi:ferredoxin-NADP reductase